MIINCTDNNKNETKLQIPIIPKKYIHCEYGSSTNLLNKILNLKDSFNRIDPIMSNNYICFVHNNKEINIYNFISKSLNKIPLTEDCLQGFFFHYGEHVGFLCTHGIYLVNLENNTYVNFNFKSLAMSRPVLTEKNLFFANSSGDIQSYDINNSNDKISFVCPRSTDYNISNIHIVKNVCDLFVYDKIDTSKLKHDISSFVVLNFDGHLISADISNIKANIKILDPSIFNKIILFSQNGVNNDVFYITQTEIIQVQLTDDNFVNPIFNLSECNYKIFSLPSLIKEVKNVFVSDTHMVLWSSEKILMYDLNNLQEPIFNQNYENSKNNYVQSVSLDENTLCILQKDRITLFDGKHVSGIQLSTTPNKINVMKHQSEKTTIYIFLYHKDQDASIISLDYDDFLNRNDILNNDNQNV